MLFLFLSFFSSFSLTVYPVLKEVLQRANMKENIAFGE